MGVPLDLKIISDTQQIRMDMDTNNSNIHRISSSNTMIRTNIIKEELLVRLEPAKLTR